MSSSPPDPLPKADFLISQNALLESICIMQMDFLQKGISLGWCDRILESLLRLSQSEFGFICELLHDEDGTPFIRSHGITNIAWDDATREFFEEHRKQGLDFYNFNSLWGQALTSGEVFISNDPDHDPHRGGYPKMQGHPPIHAFIGIPIKNSENCVSGIVGLANRPGGYSLDIADFLAPFTASYGLLIESSREASQRKNWNPNSLNRKGSFNAW